METAEIKHSIAQYKLALEDALRGLEENRSADVVEEVEIPTAPSGENIDLPEDSPRDDDNNGSLYKSDSNEQLLAP